MRPGKVAVAEIRMKNSGGSGGYRGRRQKAGNREKIVDSEYRSRDNGFGMSARGLKPRHPESRQGGSPSGIPRSKTWRRQTEVRPGKIPVDAEFNMNVR